MHADHAEKLSRLAHLAVHTGLDLRPGQQLVLTAPIEALDLARLIVAVAYRAGASLVTTLFQDDDQVLARYRNAPPDGFDVSAGWLYEGMAKAYGEGAARLHISGNDPTLLAGEDPALVSRAGKAYQTAYRPVIELITSYATNWCIVSAATPAWAKLVFPDSPADEALSGLWDLVFAASRVDVPDPASAWRDHNAELHRRCAAMTDRSFDALRFVGPGTDLVVGLADGHAWMGGSKTARTGQTMNANVPTEEIFTTPHVARVDGHVSSTRPLSYQGVLVQDIRVRFERGAIVEANARTGGEVLAKLLATDEGSNRLGEVALVPDSSPISRTGRLFFNTLYDENAASHVAVGQAYPCFRDRDTVTDAQQVQRGANRSKVHVDWMIGSGEIDVFGISGGVSRPVMLKGEWVD